jgi:NADH-quinone oxidoreductase subunit N
MKENISDLSGLTKTNLPLALIVTVMLISLAGVPPAAGFFGKWLVFFAAVDAGLVWLAIVGVFASAVSAYYYLRIVWYMWFDEPAEPFERGAAPVLQFAAWGAALLMLPILPVFMGRLIEFADRAASALF